METNQTEAVVIRESTGANLSLKQIGDRVNIVHQVLEKVLKKGTHYGTVPGCGTKMVLLKPGADVLAMTFRLVPQFVVSRTTLEGGHREFDVTCSMYGPDGNLLGQGIGSASTMEKKYRYRNGAENADIADVYNTVLKMAKKRAHVDATLTVTGASDIFTQDLIDDEEEKPARPPVAMPTAKSKPAPAAPQPETKEATGETVTGQIVNFKESATPRGGGKRWGVQIGDDKRWFGTFDTKIGIVVQNCYETSAEVTATVEKRGEYWDLKTLTPNDVDVQTDKDQQEALPINE